MKKHTYTVTILTGDGDDLPPVYFQVSRKGGHRQATTKEIVEGITWVDYAANGELMGVEMLAPGDVDVLDKIPTGS